MGQKAGMETESDEVEPIKAHPHFAGQLTNLLKKWQSLEQDNRMPDTASRHPNFHRKKDQFIADLQVPFNVAKADGRKII